MDRLDEQGSKGTVASLLDRTPVWVVWTFVFLLASTFVYSQVSVSGVEQRNREARILIRESQIASCERINVLREAHNAQNEALRKVLATAAASNMAQGNDGVASEYSTLAGTFNDIAITDCEDAFPEAISTAGVSTDGG